MCCIVLKCFYICVIKGKGDAKGDGKVRNLSANSNPKNFEKYSHE
jgi:hypothetical protein